MKLIKYDKQVYGELGIGKQILLALINLSGRLYHGKQEWEEMNEHWEMKQRCTKEKLGKNTFYMDYTK